MLPNGTWEMAAKYRLDNAEHIQFTKQVVYTIGYMIAVLLYSLIFIHFRNYRKVHKASLYDELTHLPNRRLAMSQLGQLVKSDDGGSFAVLNIDLNDFKLVNDQLGHEAGDELLKHIAHYLKLSVRTSDTVARFGGDEFIIILRHVSEAKNVEVVVEKIHQMFADNPLSWGKHKIEPSVSIGYALAQKETENVKHLLSEADHAMYKQKQKYKNKKH
ncbi:diguanylate cyclase domain-containing protein [Vibrio olivae]